VENWTDIGVELANEAGEIAVLEVFGKKGFGEFVGVPNDETIASLTPGHNGVSVGVLHHFEGLLEERWGTHLVQPFHRFRHLIHETVDGAVIHLFFDVNRGWVFRHSGGLALAENVVVEIAFAVVEDLRFHSCHFISHGTDLKLEVCVWFGKR